jgi:hypothetical protein
MSLLRRLPALFALLMLGALALRLEAPILVALPLTLLLLVLLFLPQPLLQGILAGLLWLGALAWVGMAWMRAQQRLVEGLPATRLALILGGVAVFTAWAAWLLSTKAEGASPAAGR